MRSHRSHHTRQLTAARAGGVRRDPLLALVVLVAFAGTMFAWQGWRERVPTIDLVPHYLDALAFVRDGVVPTRGTVSAEGFSPDDEYRIVWTTSRPAPSGTYRIIASPAKAFQPIGLFGGAGLYRRVPNAAASPPPFQSVAGARTRHASIR